MPNLQEDRIEFRNQLIGKLEQLSPELLKIKPRQKQRRRVMHFIPGHQDEFLAKINEIDTDTFMVDLEDSVPAALKAKARENVLNINKDLFGEKEFCVRINYENKDLLKEDLQVINKVNPDLIMIPKLRRKEDLLELKNKLPANSEIFAVLETIDSYKNAEEIITTEDVSCFVFGAEDFYSELSVRYRLRKGDIVNNQEDREKYLRFVQPLIMLATQYDIQFIDGVHTYLQDGEDHSKAQEHLKAECEIMKREGVLGKISIHPTQVEIIKNEFDVQVEEINQAVEKLKIFNENTAVIIEKGAMQDTPETAAAKRILRDALRYL